VKKLLLLFNLALMLTFACRGQHESQTVEDSDSGIIKIEVDKKDILPLMSRENSVILPSSDNAELKLEVTAPSKYVVKVLSNDVEVNGAKNAFTATLQEGKNKIIVNFVEKNGTTISYSILTTRYPQVIMPETPQSDEVRCEFVVSDGVNGSPIDGTYLNISKTKNSTPETSKRIPIRNGKAFANLKKNSYYNFKVEGQNDEYSFIPYAASDVISYYIENDATIIPIVQRPLQRITKKAIAPKITELKFGQDVLQAGEEKVASIMQNISVNVESQAPIQKLKWTTPDPMLGLGFTPTTADGNIQTNVVYATASKPTTKTAEGVYASSWKWECSSISLIQEEYIDVVLVIYDVASNRIEHHIRLKNVNATTSDNTISITDMKLDFTRYPTNSSLYSVGKDDGTGTSSHYTSELSFNGKRGGASISCKGFDLYRKCIQDGGDFNLVKHVINKIPTTATKEKPHKLYDTDGLLEDEKTYQYKVVAFTEDGKKSVLDKSEQVEFMVPKSTALLLEHPVNKSITLAEAKDLGFSFRFSNSKILKNAKEMKLGLMIADRAGKYLYGSRFKYVFDDGGKPELYFAKLDDAWYSGGVAYTRTDYSLKRSELEEPKELEELIIVDVENGTVKITKEFISIVDVNIATQKDIIYKKGAMYYWDVLDWGVQEVSDYDHATKIIMKTNNNVTVTVPVNDGRNGENAWNGRAEFNVKID